MPVKRSAIVSVISESTKEELLRYIKCDPQKIRVVYDCISEGFKPITKNFNIEKPIILQIGTGKNKNMLRVAKALRDISCYLRIVGELDSEQVAVLHECSIEYSCVSNISDAQILKEYQQCDMLVFVSTYEGFGLPILEAQATGRPVVTSNIMSVPEVAGDGACLVDPYDVTAIRKAILKVINDSSYRKELVRNGFENVQRFQTEKINEKYVKLYKQMIKG